MDSNSSQVPGMSFPQPPGVSGAAPQVQAPVQAAALPIQVADEAATDEELDQEWVNKAKDIVEQTKTDPFLQANELNKVKAEYLKTRFNKELNVGNKSSQ